MRNRHLTALATVVASAVLGAGMVLMGPAAQAAPPVYPPAAPAISLSSTVIDPGQSVTVTGSGFQALSTVTLGWTGPGARGMAHAALPFGTRGLSADSLGGVSSTLTFSVAGQHVITLTGVDSAGAPVSLTASVMVQAAAAPELSHTGFPLTEYLLAALGLLVMGGSIVFLVRRRHTAHLAAPATTVTAPQPLEPSAR